MVADANVNLFLRDRASKEIKKFENSTEKLNKSFTRFASRAAVAVFGTIALRKGIDSVVKAANKQEDAVNDVAFALGRLGELNRRTLSDIEDFASGLQRTAGVGDEVVLSIFSLSSAYTDSADKAKLATEAAIELSAAAKISLEEAARRVGRSFSGSVEDISKFANGIRDLTKEQLRAGQAAQLLVDQLSGTAASRIQTFSGQIKVFSNIVGDLFEQIGRLITQNKDLQNSLESAGSVIDRITGNLKEFNDEQKLLNDETTRDSQLVIQYYTRLKSEIDEAIKAERLRISLVNELRGTITPELLRLTNEKIEVEQMLNETLKEQGNIIEENLAKQSLGAQESQSIFSEQTLNTLTRAKEGTDAVLIAMQRMIQLSNQLQTSFTNALSGFITGSKTAKESVKDLGNSLVKIIADYISQTIVAATIGKALQKAATALALVQASILAQAWQPAAFFASVATLGSAVGVGTASLVTGFSATKALTAGIQNLASSSPQVALAEGGIVTRPTVALVGENGPEAVIPLNRANDPGTPQLGGGVTIEQIVINVSNENAGQSVVDEIERSLQTARGV